VTQTVQAGEIQSFDTDKRELTIQVLPWGVDALTARGYERFEKGAFDGLDPSAFVLRQRHQDPPTGRGIALEETDTHLLMTFKVAKTATGDDQLTLAKDGIETGASVGFEDGQFDISKAEDGRKRITHKRVNPKGMLEVSTTYIPAFAEESRILQIRERNDMAETPEAAAEVTAAPSPTITNQFQGISPEALQEFEARVMKRLDTVEEKQTAVMLGAHMAEDAGKAELKRQVKLQIRELADVVTTGNEGVVPDAIVNEMLGRIDTGRPFLNNTRRLTTPSAGTRLLLPRLVQGPLVDTQESEKAELASRATSIDTVDFPMLTVGGAADISMQLLKRSSPEFRQLWLDLLGEAYATDTEDKAIDALLAEAAVVEGGALDIEAPTFGEAFTNAATATNRTMAPDRIFLSTSAIAAFGDAVSPAGGGGTPLYPGIFSISGLNGDGKSLPGGFNLLPVWTPALDDEAIDILVGPSRAFAWAEDGTYTLEADVPSKFGRDIGLAGMIWYAPLYPAAWTSYTI